jgi:simple sugar transport system ATP-binding protein
MELLAARGLRKYYPETATLANDGIDFELDSGEIRAIVGENGAGKSTLARIIAGLVVPDRGELRVRGKALRFGSVREAESAGIGLVPQHSFLAAGLSVAENLILGQEPRRFGFFLDRRRAAARAAALAEEFGFHVDPAARAGDLPPALRRQAEILRALARGGDILVLDEPGSLLSESETSLVFALLRRLAQAGKGIVVITHRVAEIRSLARNVTVLREGRVVAHRAVEGLSDAELSSLMAGGGNGAAPFSLSRPAPSSPGPVKGSFPLAGACPLEARGLLLEPRGASLDFKVEAGEILGIAALAGNGLERLEDVAAGLARPAGGEFLVAGRPVAAWPPSRLRASLLGYVPGDREGRALALEASVGDNLLSLERASLPRAAWRHPAWRREPAHQIAQRGALAADPDARVASLSGGNRQRLVLARELGPGRPAFLLREPTQGLDLAAQSYQAARIAALAKEGAAVLLLSADLDELFLLADRIGILYRSALVHLGPNRGEEDRARLVARLTGLGEAP